MSEIGLTIFFFSAVLFFVLPYVLGPLMVYLTGWIPSRYDLKEIPWETFISERSRGFLDLHAQLLHLGFSPIGASHFRSSHGKTTCSLYGSLRTTATASLLSSEAPNIKEVLALSFTQRYSDDFCLTVNNMKDASIVPTYDKKKLFRFPDEADPASLFVKFNSIIYGLGRHDVVELPAGQEFEYISKFVEREMQELVSAGLARPPTHDGKLRFTLRGACIATWKLLWPWKGILKRRDVELAQLASRGS